MKRAIAVLLVSTLFLAPAMGFAASPWTEEATYGGKVSGKLQFGVLNTLFGWTDIFFEPIRAARKCESCDSVWTGLGKGVADAVVNEIGGAVHLLTFPIVADLPLPENGVQFATCCGCGTKK